MGRFGLLTGFSLGLDGRVSVSDSLTSRLAITEFLPKWLIGTPQRSGQARPRSFFIFPTGGNEGNAPMMRWTGGFAAPSAPIDYCFDFFGHHIGNGRHFRQIQGVSDNCFRRSDETRAEANHTLTNVFGPRGHRNARWSPLRKGNDQWRRNHGGCPRHNWHRHDCRRAE
jgi:hypothetical protein